MDDVSRAIGQLEGKTDALTTRVGGIETTLADISSKLDRLGSKQSKMALSWKHWVAIATLSSSGGGAVAHVLRKVLG